MFLGPNGSVAMLNILVCTIEKDNKLERRFRRCTGSSTYIHTYRMGGPNNIGRIRPVRAPPLKWRPREPKLILM